jgi:hypothetical protein
MKDFQEGCPMQNAIIYLMTKKANKQFQRCIKDKISQNFSFFPERERERLLETSLSEKILIW